MNYGDLSQLPPAGNLADVIIATENARDKILRTDLFRAQQPRRMLVVDGVATVKPVPAGTGE